METWKKIIKAQRVPSWIVQNEMRGVLGRMFAGAAGRILDSTNSREITVFQKAVFIAANTRDYTASVARKHKFHGGNRGSLCVKEFR